MTKRAFATVSFLVFVALAATGCATAFTGDAHISGGAPACEAKCKGWGLELAGMVAMGEYSDACVCRKPGSSANALLEQSGGASGGTAGVIMQMRRAEEQRQASMHH